MQAPPQAIGYMSTEPHPRGPGMADRLIRQWAIEAGYSLWQVFCEELPADGADSNPHQRFRALMREIQASDRPVTVIVVDLAHLGADDTVRQWRLRMLRWAGAKVAVVPEDFEGEDKWPDTIPPWMDTPIFAELVGHGVR